MSITRIRNLLLQKYKIVTTGDFTITDQSLVIVNKTSGAATAVTLPPSVAVANQEVGVRMLVVVDGKGDAGSNNITITAAGSDTINGAATYVLSANYGEVWLTDCGGGVWQASISLSGSSLSSATITNATITTETVTNSTITNLTLAGVEANTDIVSVNAAGSVIGNATALTHAVNIVSGADDTKGVQLPASSTGKLYEVYNQDTNGTHGLKIYPPVNGTINNGSGNAAINIEGWTRAVFRCLDNSGHFAASYTVNA